MSKSQRSEIGTVSYGGDGNTAVFKRQIIFTFNLSNPQEIELRDYLLGLAEIGDLHRYIRDAAALYYREVSKLNAKNENATGDN